MKIEVLSEDRRGGLGLEVVDRLTDLEADGLGEDDASTGSHILAWLVRVDHGAAGGVGHLRLEADSRVDGRRVLIIHQGARGGNGKGRRGDNGRGGDEERLRGVRSDSWLMERENGSSGS